MTQNHTINLRPMDNGRIETTADGKVVAHALDEKSALALSAMLAANGWDESRYLDDIAKHGLNYVQEVTLAPSGKGLFNVVTVDDGAFVFEGHPYSIEVDRVITHAEILHWLHHLMGKAWIIKPILEEFLERACEQNRFDIHLENAP
jgi:hypothetical protein